MIKVAAKVGEVAFGGAAAAEAMTAAEAAATSTTETSSAVVVETVVVASDVATCCRSGGVVLLPPASVTISLNSPDLLSWVSSTAGRDTASEAAVHPQSIKTLITVLNFLLEIFEMAIHILECLILFLEAFSYYPASRVLSKA